MDWLLVGAIYSWGILILICVILVGSITVSIAIMTQLNISVKNKEHNVKKFEETMLESLKGLTQWCEEIDCQITDLEEAMPSLVDEMINYGHRITELEMANKPVKKKKTVKKKATAKKKAK